MRHLFSCLILLFISIQLFGTNFSLAGSFSFQEDSLLSMFVIKDNDFKIKYKNPPVSKDDEFFP